MAFFAGWRFFNLGSVLALVCFILLGAAPLPASGEVFSLPKLPREASVQRRLIFELPGSVPCADDGCLQAAFPLFKSIAGLDVSADFVPGKGGALAANALLNKPADGSFAALISMPGYFLHARSEDPAYKADELTPLYYFASGPLALWVSKESPYMDFPSFWDILRKKPPGSVKIAGCGSNSAAHMAALKFDRAAGVLTDYLPLLTHKEVAESVMIGQAHACWALVLPESAMPGLKILAVAASERSRTFPDVPVLADYDCPVEQTSYFALALLQASSEQVRKDFVALLEKVLGSDVFQRLVAQAALAPLRLNGAEAAALTAQQSREVEDFLFNYVP